MFCASFLNECHKFTTTNTANNSLQSGVKPKSSTVSQPLNTTGGMTGGRLLREGLNHPPHKYSPAPYSAPDRECFTKVCKIAYIKQIISH